MSIPYDKLPSQSEGEDHQESVPPPAYSDQPQQQQPSYQPLQTQQQPHPSYYNERIYQPVSHPQGNYVTNDHQYLLHAPAPAPAPAPCIVNVQAPGQAPAQQQQQVILMPGGGVIRETSCCCSCLSCIGKTILTIVFFIVLLVMVGLIVGFGPH